MALSKLDRDLRDEADFSRNFVDFRDASRVRFAKNDVIPVISRRFEFQTGYRNYRIDKGIVDTRLKTQRNTKRLIKLN